MHCNATCYHVDGGIQVESLESALAQRTSHANELEVLRERLNEQVTIIFGYTKIIWIVN